MNYGFRTLRTVIYAGVVSCLTLASQETSGMKIPLKSSRILGLSLRYDTRNNAIILTHAHALWSDTGTNPTGKSYPYIFEYVTISGRSLKVPCTGGSPSTTADPGAWDPVFSINVSIPTDEDGKGYRLFDAKTGMKLAEQFFQTSFKNPKIELSGTPDSGFKVKLNQNALLIWLLWSTDDGQNWYSSGGNKGNEYTAISLPSDINPRDRRFLIEVQVFIDLRMYRKRFLFDGSVKPLSGEHSPVYKTLNRQMMRQN